MRRAALTLCLLGACAGEPRDPCAVRLELLTRMESARVHGLTENDDVREATQRVVDAAACASAAQMPVVTTHARLLAHRLAARGASTELLVLARSLGTLPLAEELRHAVATATASAEQRLVRHAALLVEKEPGMRSSLAANAWSQSPMVADTTGAFITHLASLESCLVVVPGTNAPSGTVVFSVQRAGVDLPLHGDSPAVSWAPSRRTVVRLCVADALHEGDSVRGVSDATVVFKAVLHPSADDHARGAALDAVAGLGGVPAECSIATGVDSRVACDWARGVTP